MIYEMYTLPPFKRTSLINLYKNVKKGVYALISNKYIQVNLVKLWLNY